MQVGQIAGIGSGVTLEGWDLADYWCVVLASRLRQQLPLCLLLQNLFKRQIGMNSLELGVLFKHFVGDSGRHLLLESAWNFAYNRGAIPLRLLFLRSLGFVYLSHVGGF